MYSDIIIFIKHMLLYKSECICCLLDCRACATYLARHGDPHRVDTAHTHPTAHTTHQALEPVAHYTRLNNFFNKQQSSSPSWTVLERRAHNTIFQISIKSKCWESSAPPTTSPMPQPSSLSLAATLRLPIAALQRFFTWHHREVVEGDPVDLLRFVFDFWLSRNTYKHFVLWHSIGPERDSSARPVDEMCCKWLRSVGSTWQISSGSGKAG